MSAGPSTPEEYVDELKKFDFQANSDTVNDYGIIDKLRVSLSTNGLRSVVSPVWVGWLASYLADKMNTTLSAMGVLHNFKGLYLLL